MKIKKIWRVAQACAIIIMAGCFCSCSNDEEGVTPPVMQSERILETVFGTDAKVTPFVSSGDFLFLQWYLLNTYTYISGNDGKSNSVKVNPMACVLINVEDDGSFVPEAVSDLTNVQEISSESSSDEGFVWFEKVLSVGPKIVTLRWGSDVEVVQNVETQNIVFPHLEFSQPRAFSCEAVATGETDGNGKAIYRVDFETTQTMYSVDADEEFSEKETYRIHWFVSL